MLAKRNSSTPCSFLELNDCLDHQRVAFGIIEVVYSFMSSLNLLIVIRFVYKRVSCVITGLPYTAIPVGKWVEFLRFIFFRVGKSLACHFPGKWCLCA